MASCGNTPGVVNSMRLSAVMTRAGLSPMLATDALYGGRLAAFGWRRIVEPSRARHSDERLLLSSVSVEASATEW